MYLYTCTQTYTYIYIHLGHSVSLGQFRIKGIHIYTCMITYVSTDGGDRTQNNSDCQNFQQVFTGVPVHIKHIFTKVPKISNEFSPEYKQSTRHSKDQPRKLIDLEIQIFQVQSPP